MQQHTISTLTDPVGLGLRAAHYQVVLERKPAIGWFEVHSENYFCPGGADHFFLEQIGEQYPLSFHGVGLSLGSADALDPGYLKQLHYLIDRYQPILISDHLAWSSIDGEYFPALFPLPLIQSNIDHLVTRIQQVQDSLGCQILVENSASYVTFSESDIPEWAFINQVVHNAGCGLLLDLNNLQVNATNHGFCSATFLQELDVTPVQEVHIAGATTKRFPTATVQIDSHDQCASDAVWQLYRQLLKRIPAPPTLIEWDKQIPPFEHLLDQAQLARRIIAQQTDVS